jgi:hypothetical protein
MFSFLPVAISLGFGSIIPQSMRRAQYSLEIFCTCSTIYTIAMQALPPYVSWNAFLRALDSFGGLAPDKLGAESMAGLSASLASQMMQALRFLGLVRADGETTAELKLLVEHPQSREPVLSKVFRQSYPGLFGQGAGPLSEKGLERIIAPTGLSPATQRKAVTFVLNAASYMNLPVELNTARGTPFGLGVMQESTPVAGPTSSKRSLTLDLASGGIVELSVDVDLLRLGKEDREFVFDLVDRIRSYRDGRQREKDLELKSNDDWDVTLRGDDEVPF